MIILVFFPKWTGFRRIRWIGQNHPDVNIVQLQPHTSRENDWYASDLGYIPGQVSVFLWILFCRIHLIRRELWKNSIENFFVSTSQGKRQFSWISKACTSSYLHRGKGEAKMKIFCHGRKFFFDPFGLFLDLFRVGSIWMGPKGWVILQWKQNHFDMGSKGVTFNVHTDQRRRSKKEIRFSVHFSQCK